MWKISMAALAALPLVAAGPVAADIQKTDPIGSSSPPSPGGSPGFNSAGHGGLHSGRTTGTGGLITGRTTGTGGVTGYNATKADDLATPEAPRVYRPPYRKKNRKQRPTD